MLCTNVEIGTAKEFIAVKALSKDQLLDAENSITIASWNIQSFGHNYGTKKFRKQISRIVEFINFYDVDVLLIQETVDVKAVDEIVRFFNLNNKNSSTNRNLSSAVIEIGEGINRTLQAKHMHPRVPEYAAAIIRNQFINGNVNIEVAEINLRNEVEIKEHEGEEKKTRFKRLPAYTTISIKNDDGQNCKYISLVSLHLASDGNKQMLRLNEELRALPDVYDFVKEKTRSDVILVGDLNRTYIPTTNRSSPYHELSQKLSPLLSDVKSNTSAVKDELYDNFWVPKNMIMNQEVLAATVGVDFLKLNPDDANDDGKISDHYPIIFSIKK